MRLSFSLDPNSGLEDQLIFWVAVFTPVFIAVCLGFPIWIEYDLVFSHEAYSNFIEISKLPIGLASLSIPLGVLVARLHGTKQTARQIINLEKDNRTKVYLSHFNHFNDHVEYLESYILCRHDRVSFDDYPFIDRLRMYSLMYPENNFSDGVFDMSEGYCSKVDRLGCDLFNAYRRLYWADSYDRFVECVNRIEGLFISIQFGCFRFKGDRKLIFKKTSISVDVDPKYTKGDPIFNGVSLNLESYQYQVEFILELLDGMVAFDNPRNSQTQCSPLHLYRNSNLDNPSDRGELVKYWDELTLKSKKADGAEKLLSDV